MKLSIFVSSLFVTFPILLYFFKDLIDLDSLNNVFAITASFVAILSGLGYRRYKVGGAKAKNAQLPFPDKRPD